MAKTQSETKEQNQTININAKENIFDRIRLEMGLRIAVLCFFLLFFDQNCRLDTFFGVRLSRYFCLPDHYILSLKEITANK